MLDTDRRLIPGGRRRLALTATVVGGSIVVGGDARVAAAQITVNSTDAGTGTTLAEAVGEANASGGVADTIVFDPAFVATNPSLTANGLRVNDDLTIVGPGREALTLTSTSGDVLYVYNGASLEISGISITGAADDAIVARDSGDLRLDSVTISGSGQTGVVFDSAVGDLTIVGSSIDDNLGEGVSIGQVAHLSVATSTVNGNTREGVIASSSATPVASVMISGSEVSNNRSGIEIESEISGAVIIGDVVASSNSEHGIEIGGRIAGNVTIDDSETTANGFGGTRIAGGVGGSATVSNSIFNDNEAGIGLELLDVDQRVTISDVTANGSGVAGIGLFRVGGALVERATLAENGNRAMYMWDAGVVDLVNVTITESGSGPVQAVVAPLRTELNIAHSTITGNGITGNRFAVIVAYDSDVTIDHTIITDNQYMTAFRPKGVSSVSITDSVVPRFSMYAAGNLVTDEPMVGALADNGGPTETMRPDFASPVVDAGEAGISGAPSTDQRGEQRIVGTIDIGAVEVEAGNASSRQVSVTDTAVRERDGFVDVEIMRSGTASGQLSVDVATSDGSAAAIDDYQPLNDSVQWGDGEVGVKTVRIAITRDDVTEPDETFGVELSNSSVVGVRLVPGTVTITESTTLPGPGPDSDEAITSLPPARFVDTRPVGETSDDEFEKAGKRVGGSDYEVQMAGRGEVPADARAVVMNVTAIAAEGTGFVTVHPCTTPRPFTSSLNYTSGVNLGNEIVAPLSTDGKVCMYTLEAAHLTVDVVGFVAAASPTTPLTPARFLDTRPNGQTIDGTDIGAGENVAGTATRVQVAGRGEVPDDAAAVIVNVAAVGATDTGFVTVDPCGDPRPLASSLNYVAGVSRGNELIATLDDDGEICLFTSTTVHLTADVVGYLPAGSDLSPVAPARLLDTRPVGSTVDNESQREGKRTAGSGYVLQVSGRGGVPNGAKAAVVNVTAIAPEGVGFVTVDPCGDPRPLASSLNHVDGVNGGNEIIANLTADGKICLFTSAPAHLTVDVVGYID